MDSITKLVEVVLTILFGAFAGGAIMMCVQEWQRVPSLRVPLLAFTTVVVLLWFALFLDAMRRMLGPSGLAAPGLLAAIGFSTYAALKVATDPRAHGRPLRAGIVLGALVFGAFSVGLAPLAVLVANNPVNPNMPTNLLAALGVTEIVALMMGGIIGVVAGVQSR